jgi:hypothetical protein
MWLLVRGFGSSPSIYFHGVSYHMLFFKSNDVERDADKDGNHNDFYKAI